MAGHLHTMVRYFLRSAIYKSPVAWMRNKSNNFNNAMEHLDQALQGPYGPYLRRSISADARDAMIMSLVRHFAPMAKSALDVGCAAGTLARACKEAGIRSYMGIDISPQAIGQTDPAIGRFQVADFCTFQPPAGATFDLIVFNEVLYFVDAPTAVEQVMRYLPLIAPQGVICVSMKDDPKSHAIFKNLARRMSWVYGIVFQACPEGPKYRLTLTREAPAHLIGLLRPTGSEAGGSSV